MDKALVLEEFVTRYGERVRRYFGKGGRDAEAKKGDLKGSYNTVAAIASDPNALHKLEAAYFEDGEEKVKAAFKSTEARIAEQEYESHKREIEQSTSADHERVLMTFVRPDIRGADPHGCGARNAARPVSGFQRVLATACQCGTGDVTDTCAN